DAGGDDDDPADFQVERIQPLVARLGCHEALNHGGVELRATLDRGTQRFERECALLGVAHDAGDGRDGQKNKARNAYGKRSEMLHGGILGVSWGDTRRDAGREVFGCRDASARLARQGIDQHAGELRSYAGFLVLEVYEHVVASRSLGTDGLRPARQILRRVTLVAQAEIAVV